MRAPVTTDAPREAAPGGSGAPVLDTDVVVVGAGPVGLMLAGELRLGGADVLVLDRLTAPTAESRASTLHARTMELLDQRGLLGDAGFGDPPCEPRGHFGGLPMDLTLPGPYPGQWKVPQTRTEEVLGAWAVRLGAEVRRGHRVIGLEQHPDRAVVEAAGPTGAPVRITAAYVVGCDGEDSTVRRLAGIAFPGADAERELIRADIDGIDIRARRFERLPGGLAIAARRPDGVTRVMVHQLGRAPGRPRRPSRTSWRPGRPSPGRTCRPELPCGSTRSGTSPARPSSTGGAGCCSPGTPPTPRCRSAARP